MKTVIASTAAILLAAACQSAGTADTAQDGDSTEIANAEPDVRQGEEVDRICFSSQIRNWRELDRKSVIVEKGVRDEYKLELIGTCDPSNAFMSIGLVSRGGMSCLSRGDRLVTDDSFGGSCSIRRIYEWHEDAAEEPVAEAS